MMLLAGILLGFALQGQDPIQDLIRKLGSDDFSTREQAAAELKKAGKSAREALEKAAQESDDPEVRQRARSILEEESPAPPPAPRSPKAPRQPGPRPGVPGFRGTSVTVLSNNGDSTYRIVPGDGSPPISFHRAASGQVKLDYVDEQGESKSAESTSLAEFLKDHRDLAERFGISEEGISYGGGRASFRVRGIPRFELPGPRAPGLPPPALPPPPPAESEEGVTVAGALLGPVDDSLRAQLEVPEGQGAVVTRLTPGCDAELLGLRKNDILLELDGKKITSPEAARDLIRKDATALVVRKGKRTTLPLKKDF